MMSEIRLCVANSCENPSSAAIRNDCVPGDAYFRDLLSSTPGILPLRGEILVPVAHSCEGCASGGNASVRFEIPACAIAGQSCEFLPQSGRFCDS